jgi:hypothetical protein
MRRFGYVPLALRRLWKDGQGPVPQGVVFVSMNDYTVRRLVDLPSVCWDGLRLRRLWPRTEGALGLWFCTLPGRRTVSVSVWRTPEDLRNFVRSPTHAEIMRRHGQTGDLITTAWTAERFDKWLIWRQALDRLSSPERAQR